MGWLGGSLNLENYGSRWKCSSDVLQKSLVSIYRAAVTESMFTKSDRSPFTHLLPSASVGWGAGTHWRPGAREAAPLPSSLFRGWVAGEVGEERWLHPRVQPHTGRLSAKDRARGPKGKTADQVQVNRGWLRGTQGGAQIINATGGRIWSGRRRGGLLKNPPPALPPHSNPPPLICITNPGIILPG